MSLPEATSCDKFYLPQILGLLLFLGGSFLRSRYSALNQLVSGALDSLEKFLQSAGYGTVDLSSNFGFSDLFHAVAIGLIFLGLFLVILSTIGSCAGCFMSAALLIIVSTKPIYICGY